MTWTLRNRNCSSAPKLVVLNVQFMAFISSFVYSVNIPALGLELTTGQSSSGHNINAINHTIPQYRSVHFQR